MPSAKIILLAAIGLASLTIAGTATAAAQSAPPGAPPPAASSHYQARHILRDKFAAANVTHDGRLTLAQAQAGRMPMVARNFEAIDISHQGFVTLPDIRGFMRARRAARQEGQAPAAPPAQY